MQNGMGYNWFRNKMDKTKMSINGNIKSNLSLYNEHMVNLNAFGL